MATRRSKAAVDRGTTQTQHTHEVLTRQPSGHETVHRVSADTDAEARQAVVDLGVPDDQVVTVTPTA